MNTATLSESSHRRFEEGEFWRLIPGYMPMDSEQFLDPGWQSRNSIRSPQQLAKVLGTRIKGEFIADIEQGLAKAPMALRVTAYIIARINWDNPNSDPIRRQFIPLGSEYEPDHPKANFDSLAEQANSPVPGLIRRYPDKALFLPASTCPVYCRYCTRSYSVGLDTAEVRKADLRMDRARWQLAFDWLARNPAVEDVVVSGGDAYNLSPSALQHIGSELLKLSQIRRIRIATRGIGVLPSRIGRDHEWTEALLSVVRSGRERGISVAVHTHINHPHEITWVTRDAAEFLFREGVTLRNQSVLLRGVNDDVETMSILIKRLGHLHIQPYYVYLHDLVPGVEYLRTSLEAALTLEEQLRGSTAGFHMPTFVVDLPGGGGKRNVHTFESYDRKEGISVYRSPAINQQRTYRYFDPMRQQRGERVG